MDQVSQNMLSNKSGWCFGFGFMQSAGLISSMSVFNCLFLCTFGFLVVNVLVWHRVFATCSGNAYIWNNTGLWCSCCIFIKIGIKTWDWMGLGKKMCSLYFVHRYIRTELLEYRNCSWMSWRVWGYMVSSNHVYHVENFGGWYQRCREEKSKKRKRCGGIKWMYIYGLLTKGLSRALGESGSLSRTIGREWNSLKRVSSHPTNFARESILKQFLNESSKLEL